MSCTASQRKGIRYSLFAIRYSLAGAGTVGLTLALRLAEASIRVKVFEVAPDVVEDLRASTFHPPTLDMLDRFGISAELVAEGLICPHWQIRLHPSGDRAVFDLSAIAGDMKHPTWRRS
jgi:3-(3-hydroxy-phenyl)propionate hydroxylase